MEKELRIGNIIMRDDYEITVYHIEKRYKNVWKINDLDIDFDDQKQIDKLCSPIPLTEDWLVDLGFKVNKPLGDGSFNTNARKFPIKLIKNVNGFWVLGNIEHGLPVCEFVHQLQNLYFALTGEELIRKQR